MRWIAVMLLLAGCAPTQEYPPGYWVDFRAARVETTARTIMGGPFKDTPYDVVNAYAACSTDYALSRLSPEERAMLDDYAQNNRPMTRGEFDAVDAKLKASGIGDFSNEALERLSGTCPQDIPLFKQYFRA